MRLLAAALALALLAGCVTPLPSRAPREATPPSPTPTAPWPIPTVETVEPAAPLHTTRFEVQGRTDLNACWAGLACTPPGHVNRHGALAFADLADVGAPLRVAGALSWAATMPAGERMQLFVWGENEDGELGHLLDLEGTSPLAFDLDLAALPGTPLGLGVHAQTHEDVPGGDLFAETPQRFVLEGQAHWPQTVGPTLFARGASDTGACAFAIGQGSCRAAEGPAVSYFDLPDRGNRTRVVGNLSWDEASTSQTDFITELAFLAEGGHEHSGFSVIGRRPPLEFEYDISNHTGRDFVFVVETQTGLAQGPWGLWGSLSLADGFTLRARFVE